MMSFRYWRLLGISSSIPSGKDFTYWLIVFFFAQRLMDYTMQDCYSSSSMGSLLLGCFIGVGVVAFYRQVNTQPLNFVPVTSRQQIHAYLVMVIQSMLVVTIAFAILMFLLGGFFFLMSVSNADSGFNLTDTELPTSTQGMICHILISINLLAVLFLSIFFSTRKQQILCLATGFAGIWLMVIWLVNQIGAYQTPLLYDGAASDYVLTLFGHSIYYGGNLEEWFTTIPNCNVKLMIVACITVGMALTSYFGACHLNKPKKYE